MKITKTDEVIFKFYMLLKRHDIKRALIITDDWIYIQEAMIITTSYKNKKEIDKLMNILLNSNEDIDKLGSLLHNLRYIRED